MKRIAVALGMLTVLVLAGQGRAELCEKCKGGTYIMSVGKCVECGGFTSSGAHKLCKKCSAKLGQCEHCRAPLKDAKQQAVEKPKPTTQPAKIDWGKSGTYTSGEWKYEYTVHGLGKTSESRYGKLTYDGKRIADAVRYNRIKTPWGMMQHFGSLTRGYAWRFGGWLPKQACGRPLDLTRGRLLPSPEEKKTVPSYLAAMELDELSNGKTVSVFVGQKIIISLKGNATTGYSWVVGKNEGDALGQVGEVKYVSDQPPAPAPGTEGKITRHKVGGGGKYIFTFIAKKAGKTKLLLEYKRGWEKDKQPAKTFTLDVTVKADPTDDRVEKLKASIGTASLSLRYHGPRNKSFCNLGLSVFEPKQTRITRKEAEKIIDYLAADGLLAKAKTSGRRLVRPPRGPCYVMQIYSKKTGRLQLNLRWRLPMLKRLDGLRKVLDGNAAREMDKLLKGLEGQRKEWEKKTPVKKS